MLQQRGSEATALQFEIVPLDSLHDSVEIWSSMRPVFEPRGEALDLHAAMRDALQTLRVAPGETLDAVYQSASMDLVDVENALLYNLGSSAFSHMGAKSLRLRRLRSEPVTPESGYAYAHYFRYRSNYQGLDIFPGRALAVFETAGMLGGGIFDAPWLTWAAAKRGTIDVIEVPRAGARFGLSLIVDSPRTALSPVHIVKTLVDGIVAGFHNHNGSMLDVVAPRIAERLRIPEVDAARLLMDPHGAVLGERRLVWPFRESGVQMNPADDQFDDILVQVRPSSDGTTSVRGTLTLIG